MKNSILAANNLSEFEREDEKDKVLMLPLSAILPKSGGRRSVIDENELWELSYSIKTYGVVQPVLVKALGMGTYELLAGERRIKAARLAGLKSVPALVYTNDDSDTSLVLMAVLENVQRVNLSLVDEARVYMDIMTKFRLSFSQLAKKLGKQPYDIESKVKILELPEEVLKKLDEYNLSVFHAHSFLKIKNRELLKKAVTNVCVRQFDAQQTESYVENLLQSDGQGLAKACTVKDVKILTNTISQIASMLKKIGNSDAVTINENGSVTEFTIRVPKTSVG